MHPAFSDISTAAPAPALDRADGWQEIAHASFGLGDTRLGDRVRRANSLTAQIDTRSTRSTRPRSARKRAATCPISLGAVQLLLCPGSPARSHAASRASLDENHRERWATADCAEPRPVATASAASRAAASASMAVATSAWAVSQVAESLR